MININPDRYIKIFNLREDLFTCYNEIIERQRMALDGFPNIELIYIDGQWWFNKKDLDNYDVSDDKIREIIQRISKRADDFVEFSKRFEKDYSGIEIQKLLKEFKEFMDKWGDYLRIVDTLVYTEYFFSKRVGDILKRNGLGEKHIDILYTPLYNSFNKRRHRDYISLKKGEISKEDFIKKWKWSYLTVFLVKEINDALIKEELDQLGDPDEELKKAEEHNREEKEKYDKLYRTLSGETKKLADLIQDMIETRDYRLEMAFRGIDNALGMIREIAKRYGMTYEELIHMTPPEVIEKKVPEDLKERMRRYCMLGEKIYTGKQADEIFNMFNKETGLDSVKGMTAYPGIVKGIAKILNSPKDLDKLKKGEILVCDLTTPDYLIAIKRCAAIVSNIGGITCHSAVVAREFKIPCVIGTSNATTTFKDGDMIEVDADKGIVRKIE